MSSPLIKKYFSTIIMAAFLAMLFTHCHPTKYVPKGKHLLTKNTVKLNNKVDGDPTAKSVIRQKPNRDVSIPFTDIVLWRPYLSLYNLGKPEKDKGFGHWLTEIGERPTILDSTETIKSARQIGQYYFNRGYFLNEVEFVISYNNPKQKAHVDYNIYSGPQYYFNRVEYIIQSPAVDAVVKAEAKNTLIKPGAKYDADVLEKERDRVVSDLRNRGFYGFSKTLVRYDADTSAGNHNVNITMVINNLPRTIGDSLYYVEHKPYTVKNIYVDPHYNFADKTTASDDTVLFKTLSILDENDRVYKTTFIESQIHFKTDEKYNEQKVKESYKHLTGNRVFQLADIRFEKIPNDTAQILNGFIKLQPYDKRTFSAEVEGTNTAGNYGIAGVLTFSSRNVFGGGEISDVSFRGGLEAQVNLDQNNDIFNTKEFGVELGVTFPRFVLAGKLNNRLPKRMEPTSRVYTSFSYQTRVEFERNIYALGLLYNWRESREKVHQVNLVDINYVRLPRIDQGYLESLEFKTGFQDNLIMAVRYTFLYDNQTRHYQRHRDFFRGSIETSGNVLSAINGSGNFAQDDETDQYLVFNVPYAQYLKIDIDFRHYQNLSDEHQVVSRVFMGTTYNYGNSPYFPPFEKSFLAGGSNDLRGWNAYRLGPGNFPNYLYTFGSTNYAAVGPLKLTANLEYRFPIIKSFRGAIFLDAGNIWIWDRDYKSSNLGIIEQSLIDFGVFNFDTFYKQIATNTGIGFRYDFGFFAFRLDMGIRIWDPSEPKNQRYVLPGLKWSTITYNIALGYPF